MINLNYREGYIDDRKYSDEIDNDLNNFHLHLK